MLGLILRVILAVVAFRFLARVVRQAMGRPREFDPAAPQNRENPRERSRFRDGDVADADYEEIRR